MEFDRLRVLIVEDEIKVAQALEEGLTREGCTVRHAMSGESGFFEANSGSFDLMLLDLNLPGHDGIEILRTFRKLGIHVPVIVLTARDSTEDRVIGLESGADDYLTKPFAFPELLARMKALLRRGQRESRHTLRYGDLEMYPDTRSVLRHGTAIHLTTREADILEYLLRHQDTVVTRAMMAKEIWHETQRATPLDNVIDVHIAHLRKKIDENQTVKLLHTIRGVGFILSQRKP